MTTYDPTFESAETPQRNQGVLARIRHAWGNYRLRRRQRATMIELSRLDRYLLRDIGLEPQDVQDAIRSRERSLLFSSRHSAGE